MITRIELTNFMSHVATVIEPAAGLTVLVGPNNCGKSAVVAALQILCHNENSTYVLRHGARECSVQVETDDGHTILWRRKNAPAYTIDGEPFDRLRGSGLPEPLHKVLRLPKVDAGGEADFDVHFGEQKSPIFLLGSSAATAARFFASSSDAIRLVEMQKRHKEKLADCQREKIRLEAESKQLNSELSALQPTLELDRQVRAAEELHGELAKQADFLDRAERDAAELEVSATSARHHAAQTQALAGLAKPPSMLDEPALARSIDKITALQSSAARAAAAREALAPLAAPPPQHNVPALEKLLVQLAAAEQSAACSASAAQSLASLPAPPELAREQDLARKIDELSAAARQLSRWEQCLTVAANVAAPPVPSDPAPLAYLVTRYDSAAKEAATCQSQVEKANSELAAAAAALRAAAETSLCPTCGSKLNAESLLARATAGLSGGDAHD